MDEVNKNVAVLEKELGKKFGDDKNPLLVSVRSGAAVSMPGMMNTILNLGLTDASVAGPGRATKNARFAYDAYRRLINMFGDVVMGVDHEHFEPRSTRSRRSTAPRLDTDVPAEGLIELCEAYKAVYQKHVGESFPQRPVQAARAGDRGGLQELERDRKAVSYRQIEGHPRLNGTAVNVQSMVTATWATTPAPASPSPATLDRRERVLRRVPRQRPGRRRRRRHPHAAAVDEMKKWNKKVHKQLLKSRTSSRSTTRTCRTSSSPSSAARSTCCRPAPASAPAPRGEDRLRHGQGEADRREDRDPPHPAGDLTQLLLPSSFDPSKKKATGAHQGPPGLARRRRRQARLHRRRGRRARPRGRRSSWSAKRPAPRTSKGMHSAGILTSTGGMTSHAAVVARGWGKCCVAGAGEITSTKRRARSPSRARPSARRRDLDRRLHRRSDGRRDSDASSPSCPAISPR
jgi:pyruvate,orthophosphate dikinase